jgi:hypothetical protein
MLLVFLSLAAFFPLGSYCELVMSEKKPLLQFTVAVFFFAAVRSDGINNTCCCVSFLSCNLFHWINYCEIDMLLVILSLAVIFFIGLATVTLTCCW